MARANRITYAEEIERSAPERQEQKSDLTVVRRKKGGMPLRGFGLGIIVAMVAVYVLFCHVQLTQLTKQVEMQTTKLDELTAENISLSTKKEYSMDMNQIEDYAVNTLGMVKMDTSQIEYVELANPDSITVQNQGVTMDTVFSGIAKSFSAVVEYLS